MTTKIRFSRTLAIAFALLMVSALLLTPAYAAAPQVKSLGLESPSKTMNVHVMLNLRNQSELQSLIKNLQDKSSPNYHKFLTKEQFAAQFAPTAADSKKVADYLAANGLTVTHIDRNNMAVSATGTVAALQRAFNTQIEKVQTDGQVFNRPMRAPSVAPSIAPLVKNIAGLHTMKARSYTARPVDFKTKKAVAPKKISKNGLFFPGDCFSVNNAKYNLTGTGLQAIYSGNGYPASACGYSAAEMQKAYGFDAVIASGLDGTGQIVTVVDPYGSYSIGYDAYWFSQFETPSNPLVLGTNFFIIDNPVGGTPDCTVSATQQCGWETEVTLDVEWSHAMAPGATIVLVVAPTQNFSDLAAIDLWIATEAFSGSVSHSFRLP